MSCFISTFVDRYDCVSKTHEEAVKKGFREIYLAPDKDANWRPGHPINRKCFVLHMNEPVRAEYDPDHNTFWFLGYGCNPKSIHKTDGWLPMDWYRYVPADCEEMRRWQEQDEWGDDDRYYDPNEI